MNSWVQVEIFKTSMVKSKDVLIFRINTLDIISVIEKTVMEIYKPQCVIIPQQYHYYKAKTMLAKQPCCIETKINRLYRKMTIHGHFSI